MKFQSLNIRTGVHRLRIITPPWQYMAHTNIKLPNGSFGKCGAVAGACPFCNCDMTGAILRDINMAPRWIIGVISRDDGKFYIIDIGRAVFLALQQLVRSPNFGDPAGYDISIETHDHYPIVTPHPPTPLSEEDLEKKDSVDIEALKAMTSPPKYEIGVIPEHVRR